MLKQNYKTREAIRKAEKLLDQTVGPIGTTKYEIIEDIKDMTITVFMVSRTGNLTTSRGQVEKVKLNLIDRARLMAKFPTDRWIVQ